jgi:tetratricopeptide (TPR) repeat protein
LEKQTSVSGRFTILSLLVVTAIVAVLIAANLVGMALAIFIFGFLPPVVFVAVVHSVYRLQMFTANQLTPYFYSRDMFGLLQMFCGKDYSAWALNNYATKLLVDEKYELSVDAFTRAIELNSESAHYWAHRGASRYALGDHVKAVDDLSKALELDKDCEVALIYRGYALIAKEEYPKALEDFARIECDTPKHYMVAHYRGYLHELLHHWQCAIDDYALAYKLDSTQTSAGTSLARLQAGCPDENMRDATKAIENATNMCVRMNWDDWISLSALGAAYSEAGHFDKALKYARMAFELAPQDEKPERTKRIAEFQNQQPFRIPETDPSTGRPCVKNAT